MNLQAAQPALRLGSKWEGWATKVDVHGAARPSSQGGSERIHTAKSEGVLKRSDLQLRTSLMNTGDTSDYTKVADDEGVIVSIDLAGA